MIGKLTLFHTVSDQKNPDFVKSNAPFICIHRPWLGIGYYFWDSDIELAHWWGQSHYGGKYMICETIGEIDEMCLDLMDGGQRLAFKAKCGEFLLKMKKKASQVTVREMLDFWITQDREAFNSVRALPTADLGFSIKTGFKLKFTKKGSAYLDFSLPVQVCLYDKKALSLQKLKIVYPVYYLDFMYA
jgi:hypothetical protein